GYPRAEAVLLIELEGAPERAAAEAESVRELAARRGCAELRSAKTAAERDRLWEGRRSAYAALARLAPNVMVEDGVVPRSRLAAGARRLLDIFREHRVQGGLLFHAGDGNLHPNIIFDERDKAQTDRARAAGHEILAACVEMGGSISGEHGIGMDKRAAMGWLFSEETLALFRRIKAAFDPKGLANPDKLFPLAGEKPPGVARRPAPPPLGAAAAELVESVRKLASAGKPVEVVGAGTRAPRAGALSARGLTRLVDVDRGNLIATAEAGISPAELEAALSREGLHAGFGSGAGTLGGLLATRPWIGIRDGILAMRILLADGTVLEVGSKVVKSVAGYDVPRVLLGSWGTLAVILEATFKVQPLPVPVPAAPPRPRPAPNPWWLKLKGAFDPGHRLNAWVLEGRHG
ncbi:MAG TPA: FAD-linked oxidase C-terminal domain-containing protein, partial [Elusimicrobiota bacterium]|nr:FAD-linked oxidase C-terminal domain-containing protein [Elusimicrobiota bacterium]